MHPDEARKILNIDAASLKTPLSATAIEELHRRFADMNDPAKGGSFYLQSKIYRAREALLRETETGTEGGAGQTPQNKKEGDAPPSSGKK